MTTIIAGTIIKKKVATRQIRRYGIATDCKENWKFLKGKLVWISIAHKLK